MNIDVNKSINIDENRWKSIRPRNRLGQTKPIRSHKTDSKHRKSIKILKNPRNTMKSQEKLWTAMKINEHPLFGRVAWQMEESSWCIMMTHHDASRWIIVTPASWWVIMMHHDEPLWCTMMSHHNASRRLIMIHHDDTWWCIMMTY